MLAAGRPGATYNVGGGNERTNIHVVRTICGILDEYVVGQERAKKILSVAVYNHYKRIEIQKASRGRSDIELTKANILLINRKIGKLIANPANEEKLADIGRVDIACVPIGGARRMGWEDFGYGEYLGIPRQSSWNYGTMPNVDKWTNEIAVLSPVRSEGKLATLFAADRPGLVADVDLHWDADKLLFSMSQPTGRWQVYELGLSPGAAWPQRWSGISRCTTMCSPRTAGRPSRPRSTA